MKGSEQIDATKRAECIREALKLRRVSMNGLAHSIGVDVSTISRASGSKMNWRIRVDTYEKIADGLRCWWDGDTLRVRAGR